MTDINRVFKEIDDLITAVYRARIFDPWEEGPMRAARFEQIFRERLSDFPIRNQTDIVYGGSTVLAFLLHPGHYLGNPTRDGVEVRINRLGGECFMALVEISHLGPFARIRFTRETFDRNTGDLGFEQADLPFRDEDHDFLSALMDILIEENIQALSREILDQTVPDVELDVTAKGDATIYHCLFDEE